MAKYRVLKQFRLLDDVAVSNVGPICNVGNVIDIKVKRADEVIETLGSSFLERIDKEKAPDDDQKETPVQNETPIQEEKTDKPVEESSEDELPKETQEVDNKEDVPEKE